MLQQIYHLALQWGIAKAAKRRYTYRRLNGSQPVPRRELGQTCHKIKFPSFPVIVIHILNLRRKGMSVQCDNPNEVLWSGYNEG